MVDVERWNDHPHRSHSVTTVMDLCYEEPQFAHDGIAMVTDLRY